MSVACRRIDWHYNESYKCICGDPKRHTQNTCDGCRKKFIRDVAFRRLCIQQGVIPS